MLGALYAPELLVDFRIKGRSIVCSDNLVTCDSCDFELDLASIGCAVSRWRQFLREYFEPEALPLWLDDNHRLTPGGENYLPVKGIRHRWGPCLVGLIYRKQPSPRLTLLTRACVLPMPGTLELALCAVVAQHLPAKATFCWYSASLQWEDMRLLPYLIYRGELENFMAGTGFLNRQVRVNYRGALSHHTRAGRLRAVRKALAVRELPPLPVSGLALY